jgi:putative copper resistance protein D
VIADGGLIAVRALLYGGTLAAFGLPAYRVLAPASARRWLDRRGWVRGAVAGAAAVGLAASLAHLLLLTAAMNGVGWAEVDRAMLGFVASDMPVGRAALVRIAALALVLVLTLARNGHARPVAAMAAGAVAAGSLAWNGHAMMNVGATGWAHLLSDEVHLLAAGLWFGALIALFGLVEARGSDGGTVRREAFAGFATVGTVAVAALVLTGTINGIMILFVPGDGAVSPLYLALLAGKIVLFLGALALAAHNRFHLTPALDRAGTEARLRRSVGYELALVTGTLLVVAVLGLLSPAP